MAISYSKVNWDTSKYVNPTNMNQMDNGIKAACDGVDALDTEMGTTSISSIGDGTVTGAIGTINTNQNTLSNNSAKYNGLSDTINQVSTNEEIETAIAAKIANMSDYQTAIIGISVNVVGLKLPGGRYSAIISKGNEIYYSVLFFGYGAPNQIIQYVYANGSKYWYSYSGTAI